MRLVALARNGRCVGAIEDTDVQRPRPRRRQVHVLIDVIIGDRDRPATAIDLYCPRSVQIDRRCVGGSQDAGIADTYNRGAALLDVNTARAIKSQSSRSGRPGSGRSRGDGQGTARGGKVRGRR